MVSVPVGVPSCWDCERTACAAVEHVGSRIASVANDDRLASLGEGIEIRSSFDAIRVTQPEYERVRIEETFNSAALTIDERAYALSAMSLLCTK